MLNSSKQNKAAKKKNGFTLLEMIVVLAITVIITLVIYTFYTSNSRTLTGAEAKSSLQFEGNQIQKDLLNYGAQAESVVVSGAYDDVRRLSFSVPTSDDNLNRKGQDNYVFELSNPTQTKDNTTVYQMKIYKDGENTTDLRPVSYNVQRLQIKNAENSKATLNTASSVIITVNLYTQKGLNTVEYPVTTVVKLRNKGIH